MTAVVVFLAPGGALECSVSVSETLNNVVDLREHSLRLSRFLTKLWRHDPLTLEKDGETLELNDAAQWLDLAGSVERVHVITGGEDVYYCETVMEYENARSELLSKIATELTIFQFVWGAFETVAKVVGPLSISARRGLGLVDQTMQFIKAVQPLRSYEDTLTKLCRLLGGRTDYAKLLRKGKLPASMGRSGILIDFVRRVRNRFAHGAAKFPEPEDCSHGWSGKESAEPTLISFCSRGVLFTIQMVLEAHYRGKHFDVEGLQDDSGLRVEADIHVVLRTLHAKPFIKKAAQNLELVS